MYFYPYQYPHDLSLTAISSDANFFLAMLILLIPLRELPQSFPQRRGGLKAEVLLQGGCIGVCDGYIAGLHRHEFFVRVEVIVCGQHACADQFFLEDGNKVQKVLGLVVADVVDFVRGNGQAVLARALLGRMAHHAHNALYNVVNVGEVALAVAVIEYLDFLAAHQFVGEAEIGHIGTAGRAVDGEEAKARAGDIVEFAVSVRHQLVALLRGGIEAHGVVHLVVRGIGHFLVAAVDAAAAGIHEVLYLVVAASLEEIVEANEVALYIGIGVGNAVTYARLRREVDHNIYLVLGEHLLDECLVGYIAFDECPILGQAFYLFEPLVFEIDIVVIGDGVDAYDLDALKVVQQPFRQVAADKACCARDQNGLVV